MKSKFIKINKEDIPKLATNRLKNIYRINKKWLCKQIGLLGYDTSNLNNISWYWIRNEFYNNSDFYCINYLDLLIKEELNKRNNE